MECPYDEESQARLALNWYKARVKSLEESLDIAVHLNLKDFTPNQYAKGCAPVMMSSAKFFGENGPIVTPNSPEEPGVEYIYESDDTCGSVNLENMPTVAERVVSESEESTYWDYDDECPGLLSDGGSDDNNGLVDIVDKFARSDFSSEDMLNLGMGYLGGRAAPAAMDEDAKKSYAKTVAKVEMYYDKAAARYANFNKPEETQNRK